MKPQFLMRWFLLTLGFLSFQNLGAQEIEVFKGAISPENNLTDDSATPTAMGGTLVGGTTAQVFTIRNTSATALTGISVTGEGDFALTE